MKHVSLAAFTLTLAAQMSWAQVSVYSDPNFAKPTSGYGADGTHTVGVISFQNPNFPTKNINIYYPSDVSTKVPTIFYSHAYGGNDSSNIDGMLYFVARKGYAIVYVPYQTTGVSVPDRYNNLLSGFRQAARSYTNIIDTTRVGFMGHSFGGGASFANAQTCFNENNWGSNGRFIYSLAPWYAYNLAATQAITLPSNTKVLVEVFNDDVTNDHRMAIDLFNNINIASSEKDFVMVKSATINGYTYSAEHNLPNTHSAFDALDYYAYYRFIAALCDYTFTGSLVGKNVALGNGSAAQITMPSGLPSLVQSDNPTTSYLQSRYQFPCGDVSQNPRYDYCPPRVTTRVIEQKSVEFQVYPNPAATTLHISMPAEWGNQEIKIYNTLGQLQFAQFSNEQSYLELDIAHLPAGTYFVKIDNQLTTLIKA